MASSGLITVSAEEPIPPGKIKAKVAVGFIVLHGVVNTVHVWCDYQPAEYPVYCERQFHVCMVEHGGGIQQHFKDYHGYERWSQQQDGGKLDQHRKDDFQGVKTCASGHVIVRICVMHPVQTPQQGDGMHHDMLQVDDAIHDNHRGNHCKRKWRLGVVE